MTLKSEMEKKFTHNELEVLKSLNYEHHVPQNVWSIRRGEQSIAEFQLGYNRAKTQKILIKALDVFEKYPESEVLKWLGYG